MFWVFSGYKGPPRAKIFMIIEYINKPRPLIPDVLLRGGPGAFLAGLGGMLASSLAVMRAEVGALFGSAFCVSMSFVDPTNLKKIITDGAVIQDEEGLKSIPPRSPLQSIHTIPCDTNCYRQKFKIAWISYLK